MTVQPGGKTLLEGRGIGHAFGENAVLSDIDISVSSSEIVTLIGPNGAGKTTLIRILLGLIRPDAGTIAKRSGLIVGYLPQQLDIDPILPLNVRRLLQLTSRPAEEQMMQALEEVGAAHLIENAVQVLS
ncbi:MAG: ATP-binding cassette domain-containing protein, partial [Nitrospinaceae bacterium]|nr:ATP-binding cassette domain-containing protein [Nitrospinaceae bacterium]